MIAAIGETCRAPLFPSPPNDSMWARRIAPALELVNQTDDDNG